MSRAGRSGQAMVEVAIGAGVFLLAAFAAVQLGLSALAQEGVQSAVLTGARAASAAPLGNDPLVRLAQGREAAVSALAGAEVGLATPMACPGGAAAGCGIGVSCGLYLGGRFQPHSEVPCASAPSPGGEGGSYGPLPTDLDGPQNPGCGGGTCFGASQSMAACASQVPVGRLAVCLAYTSWPPSSVDVWICGRLRTIVPWIGRGGPDQQPATARLRLQVEAFST